MNRTIERLVYALQVMIIGASLATMTGCDKKVSPELKSMISTAAFSAKERAAGFTVIRSGIKARTPADQPILDGLLESHGKGLNAQAAALNDFVLAIEANATISKRGVDTIIEMAKNSKAWLEDITALKNHVALTDVQLAWMDSHIEALDQQCQKLNAFASKIQPAKEPAPAK